MSLLAGDISGRILVTEALTKKIVTVVPYQLRGAAIDVSPTSDGGSVNEYSRIVIYLDGTNLPRPEPVQAEIRQRNRRFEPEIVVVPIGSTVSFPNLDPIFHNVFSLSKLRPFDLGYYPAGQTKSITFDRSGVEQIYCHLHTNMYSAIVVAPSRWYAQPGSDGSFDWKDVPAGRVTVLAWHRSAGSFQKTIQVPKDGTLMVEIRLPVRDAGNIP